MKVLNYDPTFISDMAQILGDASTMLTVPVKEIMGEPFFKYKGKWWRLKDYQ